MQHKDVIEVYNAIIKQVKDKIGKTTNIVYPYGTKNIIIEGFNVTEKNYNIFVARRDYLLGGDEWK